MTSLILLRNKTFPGQLVTLEIINHQSEACYGHNHNINKLSIIASIGEFKGGNKHQRNYKDNVFKQSSVYFQTRKQNNPQ